MPSHSLQGYCTIKPYSRQQKCGASIRRFTPGLLFGWLGVTPRPLAFAVLVPPTIIGILFSPHHRKTFLRALGAFRARGSSFHG